MAAAELARHKFRVWKSLMNQKVTVGVVGGGLMGCGIASKFAGAGFDVLVYDNAQDAEDRIKSGCAVIFGYS